MKHKAKATWMAYNRCVDIILEPTGKQSTDAYPNTSSDAHILWQRAQPSLHNVELAAKMQGPTGQLRAGTQSN